MPITPPSALFDKAASAQSIKDAMSRTGLVSGADLTDDEAFELLVAAEKDLAAQLRVFLTPTEVFSYPPSQAEIDALPLSATWVEDAPYDYDPEMFQGESWGFISLRHRPVIDVKSIALQYPSPTSQLYSIPKDWIRLDKKYGHIRLVPASAAFAAPLNAFIMQALGGGRTIPFMLHVRYTAGIQDIRSSYPQAIDLIKKMAVLRAINGVFPGQSSSISADGLSQSSSVDLDKFQSIIDHGIDALREQLFGVRMAFL